MTTPILILAPRITDDSKSLWKAALDLGCLAAASGDKFHLVT
ncbi:MAG TPA: hypothetical protein VD994_00210 [Prosthecobacter sp.]|nr:hypothetical protein [Prosthecobacter sp.]